MMIIITLKYIITLTLYWQVCLIFFLYIAEYAQAGPYSAMSIMADTATVKKDKLRVVAGADEYQINNILSRI